MSEQMSELPDPMPEDPHDRQQVEDRLHDMDVSEANAREWVVNKIEEGATSQQILDQLGNEAESFLGPDAVASLRAEAEREREIVEQARKEKTHE